MQLSSSPFATFTAIDSGEDIEATRKAFIEPLFADSPFGKEWVANEETKETALHQ
jgi:hypothetical protein